MTAHPQPCPWASNPLALEYHDREWGVPCHDDRVLFEFLILEGAQAGLSWDTILRKRDAYREAFDGFDAERIAAFTPARIEQLLLNPGIIRNRLKITSAVDNARALLTVQTEHGTFGRYIWSFVGHTPVINRHRTSADVPSTTPASEAMSKSLKARGFRFVGPTICYAFMQAVGMINDHLITCPRWKDLGGR